MRKFLSVLATVVCAVSLVAAVGTADAKRMGGGKSVGKGSQVTQKDASPAQGASNTASPAAASPVAAKAAAPAAAAASNRSKWLGPLAGLAAGLGLAALASHLGLGAEFGNIMMMVLFAVIAFAAFRFFMARRNAGNNSGSNANSGLATAYSGSGSSNPTSVAYPAAQPAAHKTDVSGAGYTGGIGSGLGGNAGSSIGSNLASAPIDQSIAGFDADAFTRQAKVNYMRLQAAFDAADSRDLREFTSPELFAELMMEINERKGAANRTEVVQLNATMVGQLDDGIDQHVSVSFTGAVKEFEGVQTSALEQPLNETWNFARPSNQSQGWTLVGIEQNA